MEIKSLLLDPILKSFVPLLIGGSYHLLKEIINNFSLVGVNLNFHDMKQNLNDDDDRVQDSYQTSPEGVPFDFLTRLNQVSFGVYTNLFAFLFVMLLVDVLWKMIQIGVKEFQKEAKSPRIEQSSSHSIKRRGVIYQMSENQIMRVFSYALIFIFLQIAGLCFMSFSQSQTSNIPHHSPLAVGNPQDLGKLSPVIVSHDQENDFGLPRILEQEDEGASDNELVSPLSSSSFSSPPPASDKISLSMGSILGSLNLNVNSMILSKDRKIAYVTLDYYGTLKVIDISDLQSPFIMGTLNLKGSTSAYSSSMKSLLLSSDEKTLYASAPRELEIIDITNPSSPKLISSTKSELFKADISGYLKTSLVLEEKSKTLYIGGLGLEVYDISDPKKPALLNVFTNKYYSEDFENYICLSHDRQVLFVANDTLEVYNVSNPRDIRKLYSFSTKSSARDIFLSEDGKTAFLLGTIDHAIIFEEVDISDLNSLSTRNYLPLGHSSLHNPHVLAVSPNKAKVFIMATRGLRDVDLLIFDRVKQTTIKNEKSLIERTFALDFSPDGRTLITASKSQFLTIELFLDYPNSQIFSETLDNLISNFSLPGPCSKMQISNDGKYLFVLRNEDNSYKNYVPTFEIWDVKNPSEPMLLSSYTWDQSIKQMHISDNHETAYLLGSNSVLALDIRNQSSINVKKTYSSTDKNQIFRYFTTTSDDQTGFLVIHKQGLGYVTFFDLSESSPSTIEGSAMIGKPFTITHNGISYDTKLILKDDKTLMLLNQGMFEIYDISNLDSPTQIASLPKDINESDPDLISPFLSPDKKTLYIETIDKSAFQKLKVYDVSIPKSPQLIGEKYLSKMEFSYIKPGFSLTPDLKSGFVFQENSLIRLNVTNPKDIKISGIVPLTTGKRSVRNYVLSPDGQTIYASIGEQIRILNMNIKYSLFLKQEKFLLGEKYSGNVAVLNLTGISSDYNVLDPEAYKITKLSLFDVQIDPSKTLLDITTSVLPSWISFDSESDSLTIEAKKQHDVGTYTFRSAFSLKIPKDIFKNLTVSSKDLWAWLISLDYVDNQRFLTANFGSEEEFFLPEKFENYTGDIYGLLKQFYFETCTGFEIAPSLELKEMEQQNNISVSTLSTNEIKIEMNLYPKNGSDVKFVSCPYGSIVPVVKNHNKTRISLEGSLKEINIAMNSIVANFENGRSCDASIMINDGFNPTVSVGLANISRYFKANTPPKLNQNADTTVQEQVDSADIQTGKYFTFALADDIFEDENAESLSYELVMANTERAFPTWLSLSGLTLKGTPPQEVLGRDIDLVLVAKNEFKESTVPLRLHVKISLALYLQLALKYIPYILTIVGLLVSANKIFNVLGKPYYQHFKEFYIGVGEEISPALIEPISFIKEEREQSKLIWKYLGKLEKDKRDSSLSSLIDPMTNALDKEKIIENIKEAINQMSSKDRQKMTRYPSPIIDKIVVNKFILMQLELKSEVQTKSFFEELKPHCMEAVERNTASSSPLEFIVNPNKLNELMERIGVPPPGPEERYETLEEGLINDDPSFPPGVNINLLKDAILALAFENHTLDILPINSDIGVKQKVSSNFLWRFLKLDLKDIYFNEKNKINYGINYQIIDDQLCFYGVAQNYLKGKTLVVQVKNRKQRIMKEIWIHGVSKDFQRDSLTQEGQGNRSQGYEIF